VEITRELLDLCGEFFETTESQHLLDPLGPVAFGASYQQAASAFSTSPRQAEKRVTAALGLLRLYHPLLCDCTDTELLELVRCWHDEGTSR
jgi:hypothetical protein